MGRFAWKGPIIRNLILGTQIAKLRTGILWGERSDKNGIVTLTNIRRLSSEVSPILETVDWGPFLCFLWGTRNEVPKGGTISRQESDEWAG